MPSVFSFFDSLWKTVNEHTPILILFLWLGYYLYKFLREDRRTVLMELAEILKQIVELKQQIMLQNGRISKLEDRIDLYTIGADNIHSLINARLTSVEGGKPILPPLAHAKRGSK